MKIFTITGFADEIDASADKQIEEVRKLAMEYIEVRGVDGKNVSELTEEEVAAFKLKLDKGCIKVSSIGSPIGKIKITDNFEEHLEKLEWVIKIAKTLVSDTKTSAPAGSVIEADKRLIVACGNGTALEICELVPEGKQKMNAADYLRGRKLFCGDILRGKKE